MTLDHIALTLIDGTETSTDAYANDLVMYVNVASKCGFTPQYEALEALYEKYGSRGFKVVGLPTDQFKQELGTEADIAEFCTLNYGVTFPITSKVWVNGSKRHPLFKALVKGKDQLGLGGPVLWNFEKFLVLPNGKIHRFRSVVKPDAPEIINLIEANLPR
jgi:glutathione peroxidase